MLERTLDSERKTARQLRGLFEITNDFARSLSLEGTLEVVATTMVELFGLDAAAIRLPDGRGDALEARADPRRRPGSAAAAAGSSAARVRSRIPTVARVVATRESLSS